MRDYGVSVLEQYDFEVKNTRKVRGAILVETDQGAMLLKAVSGTDGRIPALYCLQMILAEQGYHNIDLLQKNQEGQFISENEDSEKYLVKKWPEGRECDIRSEVEIMQASCNLARLHRFMIWQENEEETYNIREERDLAETYQRHNQELKKIRKFIRKKTDKGMFENIYLKAFEPMYEHAEQVAEQMGETSLANLWIRECENEKLCHGDYNYHNILVGNETISTVNFEHFYKGIQMDDLYYFLRKILEKYNWKQRICDGILNEYSKEKNLSEVEIKYVAMRLSYPEKFWKIANTYYCTNKAWISESNAKKLEMCINQQEKKKKLLKEVFHI